MEQRQREMLGRIMAAWQEWRSNVALEQGMVPQTDMREYAFAYWLIRHSAFVLTNPGDPR